MTDTYRDSAASISDRASDLLSRLSVEEKISLLQSDFPGVEHLGLPALRWGGECLHGLVHTGNATVFPIPLALAATFDENLTERVGSAIADEARAKFHAPQWDGAPGFISLIYWTPNINLLRDPRWGRSQETWGEDPHLIGRMAAGFVRGLQGENRDQLKVAACAKHFAVHSGPEAVRNGFDARVSRKLLHDTYLPHFKHLVDAGVATFMGAYNAVDGIPCCGHYHLLEETLRQTWGFDGFVVSDAGAVSCMHFPKNPEQGQKAAVADATWAHLADTVTIGHGVTSDSAESAAYALKGGCDMAIGSEIANHAGEALARGLITEADIDRACGRILGVFARLGLLDEVDRNPYRDTPTTRIHSTEHVALSREAACRSMVLTKNNGVLPLTDATRTIAVSGPVAGDIEVLLGNFYRGISGELVTIAEGMVRGAPDGVTVTYMPGCNLRQENLFDSTWTFGLAEWADVAVVALGSTPLMEGENGECILTTTGGDRDLMELPEVQMAYVRKLREKLGDKPLVAVVTGGSPVICTELHDLADAVLMAWFPGEQGGQAVADILFGHNQPGGRMPITVPKRVEDVPAYDDYSMQGRTYRYGCPEPLYPFGFGLHYSQLSYGPITAESERLALGAGTDIRCSIRNEGDRAVDEAVQCYIADHTDATAGGPQVNLHDVRRVRLEAGQETEVVFAITPAMLEMRDDDGTPQAHAGDFTISIGPCAPGARGEALGAPAASSVQLRVE